ncbi:MAG TPA: pentapeptide repeat-containing protein, partial [Aggregatilineales bacterium]|nr:pentapeptide repeat-containing protein [Aggregatilineales bacterium]
VTGINWTTTVWPKGALFVPVYFSNCDISYSVFIGLEMKRAQIIRCVAKEADFAEADLTQANCSGTNFAGSRFLHTNLTEADFTGALSYSINPTLNTLKKARFSLPEAVNLLAGLDIVIVPGTPSPSRPEDLY